MSPMTGRSRTRLVVLSAVVASLFLTLLGRFAYVQLVDPPATGTDVATTPRTRTVIEPAVRGLVLDDRGRPLVTNDITLTVTVDRTRLAAAGDAGAAVKRLADALGMDPADLRDRLTVCGEPGAAAAPRCTNATPYAPLTVASGVYPDVAMEIAEHPETYPGVAVAPQASRGYPQPAGAQAAHLVGYLGTATAAESGGTDGLRTAAELVGRAGVEASYDPELRGTDGYRVVSIDPTGAVTGVVRETPAEPGLNLVTGIDADVQALTERALAGAVQRARGLTDPEGHPYRADAASAVVMDVTDGRVLALASLPTYDPAQWVGGISATDYAALTDPAAGEPLLFRAVQGVSAPASTFKAISATAAIDAGYDPAGPYDCGASMTIGGRLFTNYESHAYGPISVSRALQVSCDTVFYGLAYDMWRRDGGTTPVADPADAITTMAEGFGYGRATGVDLPGEATGRVVDRAAKQSLWTATKDETCARAQTGYPEVADAARRAYLTAIAKENCTDGWRWRAGDAANTAIGQGDTLVTPLQVAAAYAAIANGGTLWQPRVGWALVDNTGTVVREIAPVSNGQVPAAPAALTYVRDALRQTSITGSGAGAFAGFPLDAIPVGTKTGTGEVFGKQTTSWFVAFTDRYVVVMTVAQGGTGSGTSGPSVRQIMDGLYGVAGGHADPARSLFPEGAPPTAVPAVDPAATSAGVALGGVS